MELTETESKRISQVVYEIASSLVCSQEDEKLVCKDWEDLTDDEKDTISRIVLKKLKEEE